MNGHAPINNKPITIPINLISEESVYTNVPIAPVNRVTHSARQSPTITSHIINEKRANKHTQITHIVGVIASYFLSELTR